MHFELCTNKILCPLWIKNVLEIHQIKGFCGEFLKAVSILLQLTANASFVYESLIARSVRDLDFHQMYFVVA